jgi:hypothetical protein
MKPKQALVEKQSENDKGNDKGNEMKSIKGLDLEEGLFYSFFKP